MHELSREEFGRLVMYMPGEGPPDTSEPYDVGQPFDADRLMDGFTVEERIVHAEPGTVLGEMAARAREAWADFLDETLPAEVVGPSRS
jgi:hypothetical protein